MKNILLFLGLFFLEQPLFAQQLPIFTQYREHQSYINPAFIDSDYLLYNYNINIGSSYRIQGQSAGLGPSTQTLNAFWLNTNSSNFNWAAGGIIINDEFEPTNFTVFSARVTGVLNTNGNNLQDGGLSIGFTFGGIQHRINTEKIDFLEQENSLISGLQKLSPDFGVGLFFYHRFRRTRAAGDIFYAGLSIPQVLAFDIALDTKKEIFLKRAQHYFMNVGYYKRLNDLSFLELSFLGKYTQNIFNLDMNLRWQYQNIFWLGAGASTNNDNFFGNLNFETGFFIGDNIGWNNSLKIGYGFSYGLANNYSIFGTTHEVNLKFLMEK